MTPSGSDSDQGDAMEIVEDRWGQKWAKPREHLSTWERGLEHIDGEGSSEWARIRASHGLEPEDLETISEGNGTGYYSVAGPVMWEEVRMAENRPGMPTFRHLCLLAELEGVSPGMLLDRVLFETGRGLMEDEDRDAAAS